MRFLNRFVLPLTLSLLCAGCVGTGPNTQQGAVTGGALGALAGAIIGNNSRGHDSVGGAILGGLAGAVAGGTLGNSVDNQQGTLYGPPQVARASVVAQQAPPAPPSSQPADVVTAPPSPTAIWIPGYWAYNGYGYVWTAGRWEIPPPNCHAYVAPYWANQGGAYVYVQGTWR